MEDSWHLTGNCSASLMLRKVSGTSQRDSVRWSAKILTRSSWISIQAADELQRMKSTGSTTRTTKVIVRTNVLFAVTLSSFQDSMLFLQFTERISLTRWNPTGLTTYFWCVLIATTKLNVLRTILSTKWQPSVASQWPQSALISTWTKT